MVAMPVKDLNRERFGYSFLLLLLLWVPVSVMAAPPVPNAGSLLRDIEKGKQPILPGKGVALEIPLPPEMKSQGNMNVVVKAFRFAGNHLLDDKTLTSVVKPWLNCSAIQTGSAHTDRAARPITPILKEQHPVKTPDVKSVHHNAVHPAADKQNFFQAEVIHFGDGRDQGRERGNVQVNAAARMVLDRAVAILRNHPRVHLWVSAYNDKRGSARTNLENTRQHAGIVADYLTAHGILPSRFTVRGLGGNHPVLDENSKAARADNQRVELYFVADGKDGFQNTVYFPPNAAGLNHATLQRLRHIAARLNRHPELRLLLGGHSARIGNPDANIQLSLHRAQFIASYLVRQGVNPSRITSRGFMAKYPVADNHTAHGRSKNRRVEMYYTTDPGFIAQTEDIAPAPEGVRHAVPTRSATAQLRDAQEGITGCRLSFEDLQNAARAVAKYYRDAGWVVRTYLPRQDISAGIITIQVVEARFGGTRMHGTSMVSPKRIDRLIRAAQPVGEPIKVSAIERGVLLVNDLPGVRAKYAFSKGKRDRETDLALSFVDAPRINAYAQADNGGTRSTGSGRVIANLGINSPTGTGDKLGLMVMGSRDLQYGTFSYTLPVGAHGWVVGASLTNLKYRLGKEFSVLNLKGSATTVGMSARYPVIRSQTANLYLTAQFQHNIYYNEAQGVEISHYTVDVPELSLSGNYYDSLWGAAVTSGSISIVRGRVDMSGSPNAAFVAATTHSNGEYAQMNFTLSRQQSIAESSTAYIGFTGQYASRNLDSSEFITLGGPDGVRAYPVSEAAGSSGGVLNVEWRQLLPWNLTLTPFYDYGFIQINKDNHFIGASALNHYALQGAGVSLLWNPEDPIDITATLASRIGKNPGRQANGLDQDGSFHRYRIWIDGSYRF